MNAILGGGACAAIPFPMQICAIRRARGRRRVRPAAACVARVSGVSASPLRACAGGEGEGGGEGGAVEKVSFDIELQRSPSCMPGGSGYHGTTDISNFFAEFSTTRKKIHFLWNAKVEI